MRLLISLIIILAFLLQFSHNAKAQLWWDMMNEESPNLLEAETAYRNYWKNKEYKKTGRTRTFERWLRKNRHYIDAEGFINKEAIYQLELQASDYNSNRFRANSLNSYDLSMRTPSNPKEWTLAVPTLYKVDYSKGAAPNVGLGVIWSVMRDPNDHDTYYVNGQHSQGWKTTDSGKTWKRIVNNDIPATSYIAIQKGGNSNILYSSHAQKLYKSVDGGNSWSLVKEMNGSGNHLDLFISPSDANSMLLFCQKGAYYTSDGFQTYGTSTFNGKKNTGTLSDPDFDPNNGNFYVINQTGQQHASTTLYRSTDYGRSFTYAKGAGLPSHATDANINWSNYYELETSAAATNAVYISMAGSTKSTSGKAEEGLMGVYVSTDGGDNFEKRCCGKGHGVIGDTGYTASNYGNTPYGNPNILGYSTNGSKGGGQLFFCTAFQVSNTDPNRMVRTGISPWFSEDGGRTFRSAGSWVWSGRNKGFVHADTHHAEIDGDVVWVTTDGGVYRSDDFGHSFTDMGNGIVNLNISTIDFDFQTGDYIGVAGWHTGVFLHAGKQYDGIRSLYGADASGGSVINPVKKYMIGELNVIKSENSKIRTFRTLRGSTLLDQKLGHLYSWNQGATFFTYHSEKYANIHYGIFGNENHKKYENTKTTLIKYKLVDRKEFKGTVILDTLLMVKTGQKIQHLETYYSDYRKLFVLTKDNTNCQLLASDNEGASWKKLNFPSTTYPTNINKVLVDGVNSNTLWISVDNVNSKEKIYKTTDGGRTWIDYSQGLPNHSAIKDITHHIGSEEGVYLSAGGYGVYYRDKSMSSWKHLPYSRIMFSTRLVKPLYPKGKIRTVALGGLYERDFEDTSVDPIANFKYDDEYLMLSDNSGVSTTFYNYSILADQLPGHSLKWTFQGGSPTTSKALNPKVTYTQPGKYKITLTAVSTRGTHTKVGYIEVKDFRAQIPELDICFDLNYPENWYVKNPNGDHTWYHDMNAHYVAKVKSPKDFKDYKFLGFSGFMGYNLHSDKNGKGKVDHLYTSTYDFENYRNASASFWYQYALPLAQSQNTASLTLSYEDTDGTLKSLWTKGGTDLRTDNLAHPYLKKVTVDLSVLNGKKTRLVFTVKHLNSKANDKKLLIDRFQLSYQNSPYKTRTYLSYSKKVDQLIPYRESLLFTGTATTLPYEKITKRGVLLSPLATDVLPNTDVTESKVLFSSTNEPLQLRTAHLNKERYYAKSFLNTGCRIVYSQPIEMKPSLTADIKIYRDGSLVSSEIPQFSTSTMASLTATMNFSPTETVWNITPQHFSFVKNTAATSSIPYLQFNKAGLYTLHWQATSVFGGTITKQAYIQVTTSEPVVNSQRDEIIINQYAGRKGRLDPVKLLLRGKFEGKERIWTGNNSNSAIRYLLYKPSIIHGIHLGIDSSVPEDGNMVEGATLELRRNQKTLESTLIEGVQLGKEWSYIPKINYADEVIIYFPNGTRNKNNNQILVLSYVKVTKSSNQNKIIQISSPQSVLATETGVVASATISTTTFVQKPIQKPSTVTVQNYQGKKGGSIEDIMLSNNFNGDNRIYTANGGGFTYQYRSPIYISQIHLGAAANNSDFKLSDGATLEIKLNGIVQKSLKILDIASSIHKTFTFYTPVLGDEIRIYVKAGEVNKSNNRRTCLSYLTVRGEASAYKIIPKYTIDKDELSKILSKGFLLSTEPKATIYSALRTEHIGAKATYQLHINNLVHSSRYYLTSYLITETGKLIRATPTDFYTAPKIQVSGKKSLCKGESTTLISSGTSGWKWSTGATTQSIHVTQSGSYQVRQTINGYTTSFSKPIQITKAAEPSIENHQIYPQGSTPIPLIATPSGGTFTLNKVKVSNLSATRTGKFSIKYTTLDGCSIAKTITISPQVFITTSGKTTFCAGGSVVLTSSANSGNVWSTGATSQSITITKAGSYFVTANGVKSKAVQVQVTPIPPAPSISASGATSFCQGQAITLTSSVSSGNLWSTGATTQSINVTQSGNYTARQTQNGCQSPESAQTTIVVHPIPAAPSISASGATSFCQGQAITLTSSASSGNLWSTGATTQSINVTQDGNYTVRETQNGCESPESAQTTIVVHPIPVAPKLTNTESILIEGSSTTITADISQNIIWSTKATTKSIRINKEGTYFAYQVVNDCKSVKSNEIKISVIARKTSVGLSSKNLNFKDVIKGTSVVQAIELTNVGNITVPITVPDIPEGYKADWTSQSLKPNEKVKLNITFLPEAAKSYNSNLSINIGIPSDLKVQKLNLFGEGVVRILAVAKKEIDFGGVDVGKVATKTIQLLNKGNRAVTVSKITYPRGFSSKQKIPFDIPANGNQTVTLDFSASTMGEVSQKVIFTSNETEVEKDELEVKAIGLQGHLEITPKVERLEFKKSDVYNILSSTRTLNLKNDGNKKVVIKSIKTSSGFTTDWTTNTILPQEKKALKITFNPKNLVNYSGSLTIITDVQEAPIYIGLSGEVIYISGLDNNKKQTLEKISLYPNPSRDGFTLKIEDPITGKLQVKIFDIKGTQIQNFQFSKNQKTFSKRLDMSTELPSGVYHIIVYLPGKIAHINWYAGPEHRNY